MKITPIARKGDLSYRKENTAKLIFKTDLTLQMLHWVHSKGPFTMVQAKTHLETYKNRSDAMHQRNALQVNATVS